MTESLREVWQYREYIRYETIARLKVRHKRTVLGYVWWVLDPLLFMGIYVLIVQIIFKRGGPDYPLFVLLALLPWRWFSSSLIDAADAIRGKAGLVKQVYFPKITLVLAAMLSNSVNFAIGLLILIPFLMFYHVRLTQFMVFFLLLVLVQILLTLGLALMIAHFNVFFRDIGNLLRYGLQVWFYLSPGIYAASLVPPTILPYYYLNPFVTIFEGYRNAMMYASPPNLIALGIIMLCSIVLILIGLSIIIKKQGEYAKVL